MIIPILCMGMLNLEKLSNFPITHTKKVAKLGIWARSTKPGTQYSTHTHFRKWTFKYDVSNNYLSVWHQFSSVAQWCSTLCDPMDCSKPGFSVHHQLPEFTQTHVRDAIQPSHPLSSPSPPALNLSQYQGLFQWVSSLHQVADILKSQL